MKKIAAAALLLIGFVWVASSGNTARAQAHDAAHATALAPGVNKGNIVNFDGPQYWYFYAGPGHFEVRMAFHEMGMFGNPFRQNLVFDFTNEQGKNVWHGLITSQGNTAETKTHGDFDTRKRILMTVTSPQGLVREGGYYEFEVTGAVGFDGKAGSTAGVKAQQSESLVKSGGGPLVKPAGPLVTSSGPLVTSVGPLVKPAGGPLVKSASDPLVYPGKPLIVHETPQQLKILLAADVLFDFGRSNIRPDAEVTLRQAATKLKFSKPKGVILIEGFTDSKGTEAANNRLSKDRAASVDGWLVKNAGFTAAAFKAEGLGAARPVAPNAKPDGSDDPAGRQLNRRVEIIVTK